MSVKLLVKSTPKALVCQFEALPTLRYVGWKFSKAKGNANSLGVVAGAFVQKEEAVELPYMPEYITALQCGDLVPADLATAQLAGLKFTEGKK